MTSQELRIFVIDFFNNKMPFNQLLGFTVHAAFLGFSSHCLQKLLNGLQTGRQILQTHDLMSGCRATCNVATGNYRTGWMDSKNDI